MTTVSITGLHFNKGTEVPLLMLWLDYNFLYNKDLSVNCMNEQISFFNFNYSAAFWTSSTHAPCSPGILQFRKLRCRQVFNLRHLRKGWTTPPEKCCFLLDMNFLVKEIVKLTSYFTWNKWCFFSSEWCQGDWGFMDELPTTGLLKSVGVLGLSIVSIDAYNTGILQI